MLSFLAAPAFTQEAPPAPEFTHFASRRTRAEVRDAIQRGERLSYGEGGPQSMADQRPDSTSPVNRVVQCESNPTR